MSVKVLSLGKQCYVFISTPRLTGVVCLCLGLSPTPPPTAQAAVHRGMSGGERMSALVFGRVHSLDRTAVSTFPKVPFSVRFFSKSNPNRNKSQTHRVSFHQLEPLDKYKALMYSGESAWRG